MYERLPSLSIVPLRRVCRQCCLLYFAAFSSTSSLQRQCMYPMGRWHSNFAWHPGSECRTQPTVISNPFRAMLFICYTPAQRLGFSRTAPSVVPVFCVLACRRSLPPATPRAGSSSLLTSLARSTRVSRQHTVRLGRLSALPDPTPTFASSCFPWPLPVAIYRLPK
jgi:hypothetical protein